MKEETIFKIGDRVTWCYNHQIDRSRFTRCKRGTVRWITRCATKAKVHFDGNKTASIKPLSKLNLIP